MKSNNYRKQKENIYIKPILLNYKEIWGDILEVLGYQLIKLDSTHYDATVLAKYEKLEDILEACIEKGLDIVLFNEGKLILESIE